MSLRNFCFTLNNYAVQDFDTLRSSPLFSYVIIGREISSSGTPHLQGYAELKKRTRFNTLKSHLPHGIHVERRKGTAQQASDYCKKDGDYEEVGLMKQPGKRNDLEILREAIRAGKNELELFEISDAMFRYPRSVLRYKKLIQESNRPKLTLELRPWQQNLMDILMQDPNPRTIHWYWDPIGATGKTTFSRFLVRNHDAFYTNGGKHSDIACAYDNQSIVVFDFTRSQADRVPYSIMEALKNGMLFSGKYESFTKVFSIPHVVAFANFEPDREQLSKDRWNVIKLLSI